MSVPWFALEPCDEAFFDGAPVRYVEPMELAVPAQEVWAGLTSDEPLPWCRALTSIRWTSPRPFGVGTTRTAKVALGAVTLHERYFLWEEGRRHSFYVLETNLPVYRRFAEDYLVEETSQSSCRFTWSIAAELRLPRQFATPLMTPLVRSLMHDTRRYFGAR
jgi:hypothetical protein